MHVHETLQEISSHMRAPPAAWERETCGHEGRKAGRGIWRKKEVPCTTGSTTHMGEGNVGIIDSEWESGIASDGGTEMGRYRSTVIDFKL